MIRIVADPAGDCQALIRNGYTIGSISALFFQGASAQQDINALSTT
jgi:hypothetical protein